MTWLSGLLGRSVADLFDLAGTVSPNSSTPIFLPHLAGERAPVWDASSRGVFARLDTSTGPQQLTLAVMEGVAHSARWAFEALQQSAQTRLDTVRIGGGGARSDAWCQIRADVLGVPLARSAIPAAAALGAAIIVGVGSGAFSSLPKAVRELVRVERTFEPNSDRRSFYDERHEHYRVLYQDLRSFNQRF